MTPSTRCPVLPPRPSVSLQLVASVLAELLGAPPLLVSTLTLFLQLKVGSTGLRKPPGPAWPLTSLHQLIPASGVPPAPELSQLRAPRPVPITTVLSGLAEPGLGGRGAAPCSHRGAGQPTLRAGLDTQGLLERDGRGSAPTLPSCQCSGRLGALQQTQAWPAGQVGGA